MIEDLFDRKERHILHQILEVLERIERRLHPHFTLKIVYHDHGINFNPFVNWRSQFMAAVTAGQSASFFLTATASDNSTVVLANQKLTADDASNPTDPISIVSDPNDPTGNTFIVTVPASEVATTFNLNASADATSNTSSTAQSITATLPVTISPASVPVTFTLQINEK